MSRENLEPEESNMSVAFIAAIALLAPPEETATTKEQLAEHVRAMVKESRPSAESAVKKLRKLTTKENFKSMGFDSLDEVKSAELGKPLPVLIVRLDELRKYTPKGDPYKLLHPLPKVIYGVTVKGEARCGVEVQKRDGKWEVSALGIAGPARQYVEALKKQGEKDKARSFFLIKVQALNETYLGYQTPEGVRMIHVRRQATAKDKVEARPAADVLAELIKDAKEHDGSNR
jgi:hypothetical protein